MKGIQNRLLKHSKILQRSSEFNLVDILKTTDVFSKNNDKKTIIFKSILNNIYITEEISVENTVNAMVETNFRKSSVHESNSTAKCMKVDFLMGRKRQPEKIFQPVTYLRIQIQMQRQNLCI